MRGVERVRRAPFGGLQPEYTTLSRGTWSARGVQDAGVQGAKRSRRAVVSRWKQAFAGRVTIIRRPCKGLPDGYGDVRWLCLYNGSVNNLTTSDLDYIFQNIETSLSASGESALTPISRKASQPR